MKNSSMLDESWQSEKLQKLIEKKRKDFERPKPDWAQKELQEEILFLKNELLPLVLNNTTLLFSEITNQVTVKIHEAVNKECNAIVMVIPLHQTSSETLRIATVNPHRDNPVEGLEVSLEAYGRKLEEVQL